MCETEELPNDIEAERSILVAIILKSGCFINFITKDFFYLPQNKILWEAFSALDAKGEKIELVNLSEYFREREKAGKQNLFWSATALADLTIDAPTTAAFIQNAKIIIDRYIRREIIIRGGEVIEKAYDDKIESKELLKIMQDLSEFIKQQLVYIEALDVVATKLI